MGGSKANAKPSFSLVLFTLLSFIIGFLTATSIYLLHRSGGSNNLDAIDRTTLPLISDSRYNNILANKRILVAIASFDHSQLPHLEEVLDGYRSLCESGPAEVNIVIHTTHPYSVSLIDMWNTRFFQHSICNLQIEVRILNPVVRLHLVDYHRTVFYERLDDFDVFVYTEDDIKVSPTNVAAYLRETERLQKLVGDDRLPDYNVGLVRYEYSFPTDLIIDDNTRDATMNATRVYWEHVGNKPYFPNIADAIPEKELHEEYFHMANHHQGLFMATRDLLKAWKIRKNCRFDEIRDRPSNPTNPGQPTEGTQRVWMSSHMLYGGRHCNVRQVLPAKSFGMMTVLHLPNKNYRRVGRKGRIGGSKGDAREQLNYSLEEGFFQKPDESLVKAVEFHYDMRRTFPYKFTDEHGLYSGIKMINDVDESKHIRRKHNEYMQLLARRMDVYQQYVSRGGLLLEHDMTEYL